MNKITDDAKYIGIVDYILDDSKFLELNKIEHHGISRYDHSLKVSYYSYKISKILKLDYKKVAKAGLLHDFFLSNENRNLKERFLSTFIHPKKAVKNADEQFGLTDIEKDIIVSHMFPINLTVPKYAESWIVNIVDKIVATFEFYTKFSRQITYASNLYLIFLINYLR